MPTVADLSSFLHARWDQEEHASALFHELHCPATRPGAAPTGRLRP